MFKITAIADTILKKEPLDSSILPDNLKLNVVKGKFYFVTKYSKEGNHYRCELGYGAGNWYLFAPHWEGFPESGRKLTNRDYQEAVKLIGCDVATIKAVVAVESSGTGFHEDGRPRILFEAHIFGKLTNYRFNNSHPNLSRSRESVRIEALNSIDFQEKGWFMALFPQTA